MGHEKVVISRQLVVVVVDGGAAGRGKPAHDQLTVLMSDFHRLLQQDKVENSRTFDVDGEADFPERALLKHAVSEEDGSQTQGGEIAANQNCFPAAAPGEAMPLQQLAEAGTSRLLAAEVSPEKVPEDLLLAGAKRSDTALMDSRAGAFLLGAIRWKAASRICTAGFA